LRYNVIVRIGHASLVLSGVLVIIFFATNIFADPVKLLVRTPLKRRSMIYEQTSGSTDPSTCVGSDFGKSIRHQGMIEHIDIYT